MKTILPICCLVSCCLGAASPAGGAAVAEDAEPPGSARAAGAATAAGAEPPVRDALDNMLARMPREPFTVSGRLILRGRDGVVVSETPFSMSADWGAEPATAVCALLDGFGRATLVARYAWSPDGSCSASFEDGGGRALPAPPGTAAVAGTDVTWLDISLAYLRWPDARPDGEEEFRGAMCDRVVVVPPSPLPGCSAVRLWIDRKRGVLRQAEQLDAGRVRRRMWVSSVGKMKDRWMIRDVEVKRPGTGLRTKLRVDDLEIP